MIIGEAVKQIPGEIKKKIRRSHGMRDVLTHAYSRTDERLIYLTANRDIAHLKLHIQSMLD